MNHKKAVLIELSGSHSECLYSQILFLKNSHYDVHLICSKEFSSQNKIFKFTPKILWVRFGESQTGYWKNLIEIKRYIINNKFNKVILNTASGSLIRNLMTFHFPKEIEFIGVIHGVNKITQSFSQKLINRKVKKYFVLNDYITDNFLLKDSYNLTSFYPIFFPNFDEVQLNKGLNEFWICVPGSVEYSRRDYLSLIKRLEYEKINPAVKFIFLGKSNHNNSDARDLKERIFRLKINSQFVFFDDFIQDDIFHAFVKRSDLVTPLIHESHPYFKEINGFKISGSFNLAFAYKKPLLCEESFKKFEDFRENGIFYNLDTMINIINNLSLNKDSLELQKQNMYKNPKWDFDYQMNKYISFVEKE